MKRCWYLIMVHAMAVLIICTACKGKVTSSWKLPFEHIACYSSPKLVDLNLDGILDIVIGAGAGEWQHSDTAVIAVDGATGRLLWRVEARNQMVGSAIFQDVNNDDIPDVILGGRSAELKCINGATGTVLWEFLKSNDAYGPAKTGWYNFTSAQLIDDQDHDRIKDLLIANGGDATKHPNDTVRPVGYLMVISALNGSVIARANMPDGRETYMVYVANSSQ